MCPYADNLNLYFYRKRIYFPMRILIAGATGALGNIFSDHFRARKYDLVSVALSNREGIISADLREENAAADLLRTYRPDLVIHLVAQKDIVYCERNKNASRLVNYTISEAMARACGRFNVRLVYFSSDYVFGSSDRPWSELDSPCPTTQYGIDKAASEEVIRRELSDYAIIRTAQIYGFRGDFIHLVRKTLRDGESFSAYSNLVNCPTWGDDLMQMLEQIIMAGHQGIFHCVGPEEKSRYQYAISIAEAYGLDASLIEPVDLDFSDDIRPPIVRLDGTRTNETLDYFPGSLKDNLPLDQ